MNEGDLLEPRPGEPRIVKGCSEEADVLPVTPVMSAPVKSAPRKFTSEPDPLLKSSPERLRPQKFALVPRGGFSSQATWEIIEAVNSSCETLLCSLVTMAGAAAAATEIAAAWAIPVKSPRLVMFIFLTLRRAPNTRLWDGPYPPGVTKCVTPD
jgi:hypothetical protein